MNVYDFDKTIYDGDSTMDFYRYCLCKHPGLIFCVHRQLWSLLCYVSGRINTTKFKEGFFCFLSKISSPNELVEEFWDVRQKKIKTWYLAQKQGDDLIISASPSFLLTPICKRLGIRPPIATEMNPATGKITGENCKDGEKARRFLAKYSEEEICTFYSDSLTDSSLANMAKKAVMVKGNKLNSWPSNDE